LEALARHLDQEAIRDVADRRPGELHRPPAAAVRREVREAIGVPADAAAVPGLIPERVVGVEGRRLATRRVEVTADLLHERAEVVRDQEQIHEPTLGRASVPRAYSDTE